MTELSTTIPSNLYGENVQGQFFQLVHDICLAEKGKSMTLWLTADWQSPDCYPVSLAIKDVTRDMSYTQLHIHAFRLALPDQDVSIKFFRDTPADLDSDPFSLNILEQARWSFDEHGHETNCRPASRPEKPAPRYLQAAQRFIAYVRS